MGILREPKLAAKNAPPAPSKNCDACGVEVHLVPVEMAHVQSLQVVRCVDPVACRMRAQTAGSWTVA